MLWWKAKLAARDPDPNLKYFADRLKSKYSVQIVRNPEGFKGVYISAGVIVAPATHFLSLI